MISENPVEDLQPPVGAGSAANKTPFTDTEIQRMYTACRKLGRVAWNNGGQVGEWSGEDVETFILLSVSRAYGSRMRARSIWKG